MNAPRRYVASFHYYLHGGRSAGPLSRSENTYGKCRVTGANCTVTCRRCAPQGNSRASCAPGGTASTSAPLGRISASGYVPGAKSTKCQDHSTPVGTLTCVPTTSFGKATSSEASTTVKPLALYSRPLGTRWKGPGHGPRSQTGSPTVAPRRQPLHLKHLHLHTGPHWQPTDPLSQTHRTT